MPCPRGEIWVELRAACHCLTLSPGCPSGNSSCGIAVGLVPWEGQVTAVVEGRCHWLCHPLLHHQLTVSLALTLHLFWSRWPACGGDPTLVLPRSANHILPWPRRASTAPPRLLETRAGCVCQDENPFSSLLINYHEKLSNQVAGNSEVQGESYCASSGGHPPSGGHGA